MAGNCVVICIEPRGSDGRAARWLRKHPDGVGTLNFEVEDAQRAFELLESRGGTPIDDVRRFRDSGGGELACFSIATPFGDTTFRFTGAARLPRRSTRASRSTRHRGAVRTAWASRASTTRPRTSRRWAT